MRAPLARLVALAALALAGAGTAFCDDAKPDDGKIAWYATWERALRVAKESNRPILLVAAAPQCHGISGLW